MVLELEQLELRELLVDEIHLLELGDIFDKAPAEWILLGPGSSFWSVLDARRWDAQRIRLGQE